MLRTFKDLKAWQKSYDLCLSIYKHLRKFPSEEKFGLTAQIRRAAVSVPSNIAEGYGRKTTQEYVYSCYIAYGSLCELETQLQLSKDLGYLTKKDFDIVQENLWEVERMLKALIKSLERKRGLP
jgi:four helix bundle protein